MVLTHGMDRSIQHIVDIIAPRPESVESESVERQEEKDRNPDGRYVTREHQNDNRPPTLNRGILIKTKTDPRKNKDSRQIDLPTTTETTQQ